MLRVVGGFALAGIAIGAVVGGSSALRNDSLVGAGEALVLQAWVALAFGLVALIPGLVAAGVLALTGRAGAADEAPGPGAHALGGLAVYAAFVAGSLAMTRVSGWATEVDRRTVAAALFAALVVAAGWGLGLGRLAGLRRALARAGVVGYALVAVLVLAPVRVAVSKEGPPATSTPDVSALAQDQVPRQVVLIGIDGWDPRMLERLVEAGRMPNWAKLEAEGVRAPLETQLPTWSPIIWNTVATGQPGSRHGILDFSQMPVPGLVNGVQRVRVVERLALQPDGPEHAAVPAHTGLSPLIYGLFNAGVLGELPVRAYHRRVKALWNILSDVELRVAVLGWWTTTPAERVNGYLIADDRTRLHAQLLRQDPDTPSPAWMSWPRELIHDLAQVEDPLWEGNLPWGEDAAAAAQAALELPLFVDLSDELRAPLAEDWPFLQLTHDVFQNDRFRTDTALRLLEDELDFVALYWQGVDAMSHRMEPHARDDPRYLVAVERYYEEVDRLLGLVLARRRDNTTYLVVSDHGWQYEGGYGHYHAPPGTFLIAGAGVRPGANLSQPPHVRDVTPTVLGLLGLPASDEMQGRVITEVLDPPDEPLPRIATYGSHRPVWSGASATAESDREAMKRLRELGYVR